MPGYGLKASKCEKCGDGVMSCNENPFKCYAGYSPSNNKCSCPSG